MRRRDRARGEGPPRAHGTCRRAPAATNRAGGDQRFPPATVAASSLALNTGQFLFFFLAVPAKLFQLVVQGDAVNAQHLGGASLVAAGVFEHAEDMVLLDIFQAAGTAGVVAVTRLES